MEKVITKFDDIEIQKQKFRLPKVPISIKYIYIYVYIDQIVVFNKISFDKKGFKYFIGYEDLKKIRPLCIFLQISVYRKELCI